MNTRSTKSYPHVAVLACEGEGTSVLAIAAVLGGDDNYPAEGRIIVGTPTESDLVEGELSDAGQFSLSPAWATMLGTQLINAARDVTASLGPPPGTNNPEDHDMKKPSSKPSPKPTNTLNEVERAEAVDRIELRQRISAANALIASIASVLGLEQAGEFPITLDNLPLHIGEFVTAIHSRGAAPARDDEEPTFPGTALQPFSQLVDREIDRLADTNEDLRPGALADALIDAAQELGIEVRPGTEASYIARNIADEIRRLKHPPPADEGAVVVATGDSLAQAIEHNVREREHLQAELRRCRAIVSRVTSALQILKIDPDGTEIIEKVQRWESIKYKLKQRIHELRGASAASPHKLEARAELTKILAMLVSSKQLAEWVGALPSEVADVPAILEAANTDPLSLRAGRVVADGIEITEVAETSPTQIAWLIHCPGEYSRAAFELLPQSRSAREALASLVNLVVLPILDRQLAAAVAPPQRHREDCSANRGRACDMGPECGSPDVGGGGDPG